MGDAGVEFVEGGCGEVLQAVVVGTVAGGTGVVVCIPDVCLAHHGIGAEEVDVGGLVVFTAVGDGIVVGDVDVVGLAVEPDQIPGVIDAFG